MKKEQNQKKCSVERVKYLKSQSINCWNGRKKSSFAKIGNEIQFFKKI